MTTIKKSKLLKKWKCSHCDKTFNTQSETALHENEHCEDDSDDSSDDDIEDKRPKFKKYTPVKCNICGRNSHMSHKCYASTHISGYRL